MRDLPSERAPMPAKQVVPRTGRKQVKKQAKACEPKTAAAKQKAKASTQKARRAQGEGRKAVKLVECIPAGPTKSTNQARGLPKPTGHAAGKTGKVLEAQSKKAKSPADRAYQRAYSRILNPEKRKSTWKGLTFAEQKKVHKKASDAGLRAKEEFLAKEADGGEVVREEAKKVRRRAALPKTEVETSVKMETAEQAAPKTLSEAASSGSHTGSSGEGTLPPAAQSQLIPFKKAPEAPTPAASQTLSYSSSYRELRIVSGGFSQKQVYCQHTMFEVKFSSSVQAVAHW